MDLGKRLQFPENFTESTLRADIVLHLETSRQGCRARSKPIEVGCRGFTAQYLCKAYSLQGITGVQKEDHQNHHSGSREGL